MFMRSWAGRFPQPLITKQGDTVVKTERELRLAISKLISSSTVSTNEDVFARAGGRVVISAPITIKSTIFLPAEAPGVIIDGSPGFPLHPGQDLGDDPMFSLSGSFQQLRGIFAGGVYSKDAITRKLEVFAKLTSSSTGCVVDNCRVNADKILLADSADTFRLSGCSGQPTDASEDYIDIDGCPSGVIIGNHPSSNAHLDIDSSSSGIVVSGNHFPVWTVDCNGDWCTIGDNHFFAGTLNLAGDNNAASGNTRVTVNDTGIGNDTTGGNV